MPGHKGHFSEDDPLLNEIAGIDITEITGFDDLHHATGIIKTEEERAAALFGVKRSHILVGGSSAGILAAICSQTAVGDKILVDRGSHRSVYHAVYLGSLKAYYLNRRSLPHPFSGGIEPEEVERMMDESGARVVCITSPTYEGVVSDIKDIARIVHERGGILIVDEAHGAHLSLISGYQTKRKEGRDSEKNPEPLFPQSAAALGADIVIQSLHKTMPSLTQTALIHICSKRVDERKLNLHLKIHQTSSPSYILMASVSRCLDFMTRVMDPEGSYEKTYPAKAHNEKEEAADLIGGYLKRLTRFYERAARLENLKVILPGVNADPSKIVILARGLSCDKRPYGGKDLLEELLSGYGIDLEMAAACHAIAMTSVMDTDEGFERLGRALLEIDQKLTADAKEASVLEVKAKRKKAPLTIREALDADSQSVSLSDAPGRICAEFIYAYPPGIPLVVPGEYIEKEDADRIIRDEKSGIACLRETDGICVVVKEHKALNDP